MATTHMRERLGNYRVVSRIGEGGMGTVYRVEHALLGRAAAVKVLQPELSRNQDMINRFFNEARGTAQLQHPGIVDVFDFGYCEDGAAFIVMELLNGESLTSRLAREGQLPWPKACNFVRQIAWSLAAAHHAQIVHRDLKPDNVFLVVDPEQREERTKVLDFGIAKLADTGSSAPVKTHAGLIMGTPTYMSPQQCRGAGQVDHRADIYSLGCMLFEMVCGRPPFVGEGFGDLLHAHMTLAPPSPRQLAAELPGPLEQLILRMLAKAEADRPQSMEAVATEIDAIAEAYGADVGSTPRPSSTGISGGSGGAARTPAVTTFGGSTGQVVPTATTPRRRLPYLFAGAAVVGVAATLITVVVTNREAPPEVATATTSAATTAAVATPGVQPTAPPAPRKRSPKIGLVKQMPVEPAGDQAPASTGRPGGAADAASGGATLAGARSPGSTSGAATLTMAGSAGPASAVATLPPAGSAGSADLANALANPPGDWFAALLSMTGNVPSLDPAATDDWLVSTMGPEVALTVTSSPPGADVAFDGQILGKTPLSLSVDRGRYDFTLVLTLARHAERSITISAALDRTEHVVLPPLIARKVTSKPPGAELMSNGESLGTTPLEIELPQTDQAEPLTLRLAGYLEQTIEIVPNQAGTTNVVLEREPQPVSHELACDPECEVVLDGDVVGKAAPGSPYRAEFLELKGQWRTYVLRPIGNQRRQTSFRAPADRSVKTTIRLPCAPWARPKPSAGPRVYDPYDACREK